MHSLVENGCPHEWYRPVRFLLGQPDINEGFGAGLAAIMNSLLFLEPQVSGSTTLAAPLQKSIFRHGDKPVSRFDVVLRDVTRGPNIDIVGNLAIPDQELGYKLLETMLTLTLSVFGADSFTLSEMQRKNFKWLRIRPDHPYSIGENGLNIIPVKSSDTHVAHSSLRQAMQKPFMVDEHGHLSITDTVEHVGEISFPQLRNLGQALFYASKTALTLARQPDLGYLKPDPSFGLKPRIFTPRETILTAVNFALADIQNHESTMETIDRLDLAPYFNINRGEQVLEQISPDVYPVDFVKLLSHYLPLPIQTLIRQLNATPNDVIKTRVVPTVPEHLFSEAMQSMYSEAINAMRTILKVSTSPIELTDQQFSAISFDAKILSNPPIYV